jgi:hypothetical protein
MKLLGLPEPADFWTKWLKMPEKPDQGLWNHLETAKHPLLRELAGLALRKGLSQADLAVAYNKFGEGAITSANVTSHFRSPNPRKETLHRYQVILGMTALHRTCLEGEWPAARWPNRHSKLYGAMSFVQEQLLLDSMAPRFKNRMLLNEIARMLSQPENEPYALDLISRADLDCERRFQTEQFGKRREDVGRNYYNLTLEAWVRSLYLEEEFRGTDWAFDEYLVKRNADEAATDRALLDLFDAMYPLLDYRPRLANPRAPASFNNVPILFQEDLSAVLLIASQLFEARGFNIHRMREALWADPAYESWVADREAARDSNPNE